MPEVEAIPVFLYTCQECGADNVVHPIVEPFEVDADNADEVGLEEGEYFVSYYPDNHKCPHCRVEHEIDYPADAGDFVIDDDDEDDD